MEYDDFVSFMTDVVLPRQLSNPSDIRLDGQLTGGNREVAGTFWHNRRLWKVHSDTHYEPLLIALYAAEEGDDPFIEEGTDRGECLALIPELRSRQRSRHKYLYIYALS